MQIIHYKYKELLLRNELILIFFFFTLSYALIVGYMTPYLYEIFNLSASAVGFISLGKSISFFIASYLLSPFLLKYHEKKVLYISIISLILILVLTPSINQLTYFIVFVILIMIFTSFRTISFNILYRDSLNEDSLVSKQGILFSFFNTAFFISIFLGSAVISTFDVSSIFYLSAIFLGIGFILLLNVEFKEITREEENQTSLKDSFKHTKTFFKNEFHRNLYFVSSGIHLYWASTSFFIILILQEGFSSSQVGLIFSLCYISLILNEYHASKLTQKYSFKTLFLIGYSITILSLFLAFLSPSLYFQIGFFILASLGYSFIEPTREILFFKKTSSVNEEKFYPIQASCNFFGLILGFLLFSIFFLIPAIQDYFLLLVSGILSLFVYFIFKIKD